MEVKHFYSYTFRGRGGRGGSDLGASPHSLSLQGKHFVSNWRALRTDSSLRFHLADAGQSKCRLERAQALEQAKKPQEAVFVPECGEDGSFTQVRPWEVLH